MTNLKSCEHVDCMHFSQSVRFGSLLQKLYCMTLSLDIFLRRFDTVDWAKDVRPVKIHRISNPKIFFSG